MITVAFIDIGALRFASAPEGIGSVADLLNVGVATIIGWTVWLLSRRT